MKTSKNNPKVSFDELVAIKNQNNDMKHLFKTPKNNVPKYANNIPN